MKKLQFILFFVLLPFVTTAQNNKSVAWSLAMPEVSVYGKRPMKEIGAQVTKFDSAALKENIALSMADILMFNSSIFVKNYGRATLSTVSFRS